MGRIARGLRSEGDGAVATREPEAERIMVVDDNHDWSEALSESLEILGYQTQVAHDAFEALEKVTQFKPQVMLIDIGMPGMDGYELVRKLRAIEELGQPKLIAVTGMAQEADRVRALDAGFDRHFVKPLDLARLEFILSK